LTAIFWGGTFVAGRVVTQSVGPFSAAFLRFALASACLLLLVRKIEGGWPQLKPAQLLPVLVLGLSGVFAYNVLFFKGLKMIEAGRASLIIANNPIMIALLSVVFFRERLTALQVGGILLSVSGAAVVISHGQIGRVLQGPLGWGEIYIFGCVMSWVTYSLVGKAVLRGLSPLVAVAYSSTVGAVCLLWPALGEGMAHAIGSYPPVAWFSLGYLGVFGTVLGFLWYYEGIQAIGATKASLFINFVPVSAVLMAFLILREPVTISLLTGGVLVTSGVFLTNRFAAGRSAR
jgi:drug/metabolite transporter (DMT)-like permease